MSMKPLASKIQENRIQPNTVAVQCEVHLVLERSNKGRVGSNPNWDMGIYLYFCIVLHYLGTDLSNGKSSIQGILQTV